MKYLGNKHLDAEIEIDVKRGVVNFDYTSMKFKGAKLDSNCFIVTSREKVVTNKLIRFFYKACNTIPLWFIFISSILPFIEIFGTHLFKRYWNKYNIQYHYQKVLKETSFLCFGYYTKTKEGSLCNNKISFVIPNNLYIEYELSGDYENQISKIQLKRNYIQRTNLIDRIIVQHGWRIIFEFNNPPTHGKCQINYSI